jgi:D-glycero-alpha-D-manno-heptose 1-phosphate guanylyltransferase
MLGIKVMLSVPKFPDVVILAGGLGKRLKSVTGDTQKVLAKIGEKPFLEILIDYIASQGAKRFILCVGHGSDEVEAYFKDKYQTLEIIFSKEEAPLGTGGAIKRGSQHVKTEHFLAMNGDCFCVIDYNALIAAHRGHKANATIAITELPDVREYGSITVNEKLQITGFKEKSALAQEGLINTGTYCLGRGVFDLAPTPQKFSIEYDFFPHLVGQGFYAFEVENRFIDIGTPERYQWAQEHLRKI